MTTTATSSTTVVTTTIVTTSSPPKVSAAPSGPDTKGHEPNWIVALLAGALLTLIGGLLGTAYEARKSNIAWQRDQRLRCYADLISITHEASKNLWDLARANSLAALPDATLEQRSEAVNTSVALVNGSVAQVEILGSDPTVQASKSLESAFDDASKTFHDATWATVGPDGVPAAFNSHARIVALNNALDAFVAKARDDVSVEGTVRGRRVKAGS